MGKNIAGGSILKAHKTPLMLGKRYWRQTAHRPPGGLSQQHTWWFLVDPSRPAYLPLGMVAGLPKNFKSHSVGLSGPFQPLRDPECCWCGIFLTGRAAALLMATSDPCRKLPGKALSPGPLGLHPAGAGSPGCLPGPLAVLFSQPASLGLSLLFPSGLQSCWLNIWASACLVGGVLSAHVRCVFSLGTVSVFNLGALA